MQPLEYPKFKYSNYELKKFALQIKDKKVNKKPIRKKKDLKLTMQLNNVYVIDDYIFLDISIENNTNLSCNIEGMKFSIEDKKIYKATNNQSILLNPLFSLNDQTKVRKSYRNIFVFEKFTFPNSKILKIRLIEEQISGRVIDMKINQVFQAFSRNQGSIASNNQRLTSQIFQNRLGHHNRMASS